MHPHLYISLHEPHAKDFFLGGSRSLKALLVGLATSKSILYAVRQAIKTKVRDPRGYRLRESRAASGCRRTGLLLPMRIETQDYWQARPQDACHNGLLLPMRIETSR